MKKSRIILMIALLALICAALTFCEAHYAFVYDKPVDADILADIDAMRGAEAEFRFTRGQVTKGCGGVVESGEAVLSHIGITAMPDGGFFPSDYRIKDVTVHARLWWNPFSVKHETDWSPVFYGIIPTLYYLFH